MCTYDCQGMFLLYHEWLHIQGLYMYKQRPTVTEATDDGSKQGIIIVLNKSLYIQMTNMGLCMLVVRPYYLELVRCFYHIAVLNSMLLYG